VNRLFKSGEFQDRLRKEAGEMPAKRESRPFRMAQFMKLYRVTIQASASAVVLLFLLVAHVGDPAIMLCSGSMEQPTGPQDVAPFHPSAITQYIFTPGSYSYGGWSWTSGDSHRHAQNHGNEFSMGQDSYSPYLCIEQTNQNLYGYFYSGTAYYGGPPLNSLTARLDVRTAWEQNYGDDGGCYYEVDFEIQKNVGGAWLTKANVNNIWIYTGKVTNPGDVSRTWGSGVVDGPGNYRLRIYMRVDPPSAGCLDKYSLFIEDFALYGEDNVPPSWVVPPTDQTVEYGHSFTYDLDATDSAGIGRWEVSPTSLFSISSAGVITSRSILSVGEYSVQVWVYDTQNNYRTGTFRVRVRDTTDPTWNQPPVSQTVEFGDAFYYDVDASDLSGISSYWISLPGYFTVDSAGGIWNRTHLSVGIYNLEIRALDPYNNYCSASISVTVQDTTDPTWDEQPADQIIEFGHEFYYDVDASDLSGISSYWVSLPSQFTIDSAGVIRNRTQLSVGTYNLEIRAYDPYGHFCSAFISATVRDTTDPTWDEQPADRIIEFGHAFSYDVDASDLSGIARYWVSLPGQFAVNGAGVITNATRLSVGTHNLEIRAFDPYDNFCSAFISVSVQDTTDPIWDQLPTDQVIRFDERFGYIVNASDLSGIDHYWVNDTSRFAVDVNGLITNKTVLPVGIHGLVVRAYDPFGNSVPATFSVTVLAIDPVWVHVPLNQTTEYGLPFLYALNASDAFGITWWWVNDTTFFSIDSSGLLGNVSLLPVGKYWLEVRAYNQYDLYCSANMSVNCSDTTSPTWLVSPSNQNLEFGSSMSYDLDAIDLSLLNQWWINDTSNFAIDSNALISNLGDPPVGQYGILVSVNDIHGNVLTGDFSVTVEDTTPPDWVETPTDQTILYNDPLDYQLSAADLSGIGDWSINDTSHFAIRMDGRITSIGVLDVGQYGILVSVSDPYGNSLGATFTVSVQPLDTTPPPPDNMMVLVASVSIGAVAVIVIVIVYLRRQGSG